MVASRFRNDNHAQLLLIGAVAVSLVILTTVVLLNGLQFNSTVGSDDNEQVLRDAQQTRLDIERDLTELSNRLRAQQGIVQYNRTIAQNISVYSRYYSNLTFNDGIVYVNVSLNRTESQNGTVVNQTSTGTFDDKTGATPWTLSQDIAKVSHFNLTFQQFSSTGQQIDIRVENNTVGSSWVLRLDGNTLTIRKNGSLDTDFGPQNNPVNVKLKNGTKNQTTASGKQFDFAENVDKPYDIEIEVTGSGSAPKGTYRLVTDGRYPGTYGTSGTPDVTWEMFYPAVDLTYQRPELDYQTTILLRGDP